MKQVEDSVPQSSSTLVPHSLLQMFVLHIIVQMFLHMLSVSLSGVGSLSHSVFESNYLWRLFFFRHLNCEFCIKKNEKNKENKNMSDVHWFNL